MKCNYLSVSVAVGVGGGSGPEHVGFGRSDFLYSGAFCGWPLPKNHSGSQPVC